MKIHSRKLDQSDFNKMKTLILEYGPNDWNFLSEQSIEEQFQLIRDGNGLAVLAENDEILAFAVLIFREFCPAKLAKYTSLSTIDYINDVVVNTNHSGKGIGNKLLNECMAIARQRNSMAVYIERHEENLASAGMMRKAGFEMVETHYDPTKRFVGTKNTSVLKKST